MTSDSEFLEVTLPAMDMVYNLARRSTRSRQDAEDLVQQTYLNALQAWRRHRGPKRVEPWLATICLNIVRSDYRRQGRRPVEQLQPDPDAGQTSGDDPEAMALAAVDRAVLHQALWELSEQQRTAIVLVDLCGFTAQETAGITGSPRSTVLARVHRGRKALAARAVIRKAKDREP